MKVAAIISHPLSNTKDIFSLKGNCICCGEPVDGTWTYHRDYKLEQWVGRARGKAGIVTVKERLKDSKGIPEKGHVQFSAPLCAKHLRQTHKLRHFEIIEFSLVAVFILLSLALYIAAIVLDWPLVQEWELPVYAKYLILPFVVLSLSLFSGILCMTIGNKLLSKLSFFHDFPLENNAGGISGLGIDINQANQKERGVRVKYELVLNCTSQDVAAAFLSNYPQAIPVQSQIDYLARKMQLNREKSKYTGSF